MNVDKLIEDGQQTLFDEIYKCNAMKAFEFGVRHAIAAMFPVVEFKDLPSEDCTVMGLRACGDWWPLWWDAKDRCFRACGASQRFSYGSFDQIRRCPTPLELGIEMREEG